jgi:hypothetical protein
MIVFMMIGGWLLAAILGGVCFSLWLRFCGHREPAAQAISDLALPAEQKLRVFSETPATPAAETVRSEQEHCSSRAVPPLAVN